MDLINTQPAIVTSQMPIDDKIDYTISTHKINENMLNSRDLCCVFKILKAGIECIHIVSTNDLWNKMSHLYSGFAADFVDIMRIVDVKLANENWESSDYTSEIYSCIEEYRVPNLPYGFYSGNSMNNILQFFDYKLMEGNFNNHFVFKKRIDINYQYINIDVESEDNYDPYIYNCVGDECPNMTNGSQFCRRTFCETEDSNKRQRLE